MLLPEGKNLKIWGVSYGITGDLIMGLPVLTYFEKKYPGSYKVWAIEKKVGYMAPFFLNHPLIDQIRITQKWDGMGEADRRIVEGCYIACTHENWKHSRPDWYNYTDCIWETAYIAGIDEIYAVLSDEDCYPKLKQWFDVGTDDPNFQTYSKENGADTSVKNNTIALFPFATATSKIDRSPSINWYDTLARSLVDMGYDIYQFGYHSDYKIAGARQFTHLTFFDQVRLALSCKMSIGTDSGNMWVMGAYSHPAVHLMTNWMVGHKRNFDALLPRNKNGVTVFAEGGANNISREHVLGNVHYIMEDKG
jgi:ADP-heptose:LPS heptosyltransferase